MEVFLSAALLKQLTLFAIVFLITFVGSYVRDFVTSFEKTENKMRVYFEKIFASALGMSILLFFFGEGLIVAIGVKYFLGVCFIAGMASYSVLPLFFTLEGLTKLVRFFGEVRGGIVEGIKKGIKEED